MSEHGRIAAALERLSSEHVDEVADAMEDLRAIPDQDAVHAAVVSSLVRHDGAQAQLARLLGEWGRPESIGPLVDAMTRGEHSLRVAAASALAGHAHPDAAAALVELAAGDDAEVAHVARLALGVRRSDDPDPDPN